MKFLTRQIPLLTLGAAALLNIANVQADEPQTQACPDEFYQVPLYPGARLCQVFSDTFPAAMTYHADASIEQARDFYQQQLNNESNVTTQRGRVVMTSSDERHTIIISKDGAGSQVDILVKSAS